MPDTAGIAAVDELDALLTAEDFEPTADVDTIALDATLAALDATDVLVARLIALRDRLADGDAECTLLAIQVANAVESVAHIVAAGIA